MEKMRFEYVPSGANELATSVLLPESDGPWPTVIVVHGLTGSRMGKSYHLVEFARKLAERGIACVRFDQAGCGESTGKFEDLTIRTMADDARAVYEWTRAQPWCDPRPRPRRIGVTALSLGALASLGLPDGMGLALWAGVFDLPGVFKVTAKTGLRALLEHQGWIPYRGLRIGKGFIEQLGAIRAEEELAKGRSPLLVCHSRVDQVVPIGESDAYSAACERLGRPCERVVFEKATHDFVDYPDRMRLLETTVNWFAARASD